MRDLSIHSLCHLKGIKELSPQQILRDGTILRYSDLGAGNTDQLIECLTNMHKAMGLFNPQHHINQFMLVILAHGRQRQDN